MKRERPVEILFLAAYLSVIGIIALAASSHILKNIPTEINSHIQTINAVQENSKILLKAFEASEHYAYANIKELFFARLMLLRAQIINYTENLIFNTDKRSTFIALFMCFSGLYYFFTGLTVFFLKETAINRLKIATSLWIIAALTSFIKILISEAYLKILTNQLAVLSQYIPATDTALMPSLPSSFLYLPLLFFFLLLNMIIYIIIPLWYINLTKVKKHLK